MAWKRSLRSSLGRRRLGFSVRWTYPTCKAGTGCGGAAGFGICHDSFETYMTDFHSCTPSLTGGRSWFVHCCKSPWLCEHQSVCVCRYQFRLNASCNLLATVGWNRAQTWLLYLCFIITPFFISSSENLVL